MLANVAGLLDVGGDFPELAHADVLEIHDRAARLNKLASLVGAHGQSFSLELLILDDELLQLAFRRGDLIQCLDVQLSQLLNVQRPAILEKLSSVSRSDLKEA